MKIKAMKTFLDLNEYIKFSECILLYNWKIEKQLLKDRVEKYRNLNMFQELKLLFENRNISIFPLKEEEIVTWFDTMLIMRKIINSIKNRSEMKKDTILFMEYPLVFGNYMRTDYLMAYDRLIIVLEFGMFNQDERRSEERYTKKLHESMSHAQLIRNMVHSSVSVINYVFIYKPEFDRLKSSYIQENINYNLKEIEKIEKFILLNFNKQDEQSAVMQLEKLENYLK